jgi:hypothetical protein
MKKILSMLLIAIMILSLCACSKQELADMTTEVYDDYSAIVWEDKTYVPYCAISKTDCGAQIGIVDGDKDDRVYEYKGYSTDEWIINYYVMDSAMLYREINVTIIPDGLQSEYEWNN